MAKNYTEEQLNQMSTSDLVKITIALQNQLAVMNENYEKLDHTMQLMLEQLADANRHRFGRSTERFEDSDVCGQISFIETDNGIAFFNEAEAVCDISSDNESSEEEKPKRGTKRKGKREEDLKGLPVRVIPYTITDEKLNEIYGDEGYKRLPDEIQRQYYFRPAEIGIEEMHIAVYSGKISEKVVKANHPVKLLHGSLVSPSLAAGVMTAKYVNATPLYRQETSLNNDGISVTRKDMADWMIKLSNRYLSRMYDKIHELILEHHVIQADETPVTVNKDGRPAGSKSYMWVYRTGVMDKSPSQNNLHH